MTWLVVYIEPNSTSTSKRSISTSEFSSPCFISKVLHYNGIVGSLKLADPCPWLTSLRHCCPALAALTLTTRLNHLHAIDKQPRWAFRSLWNRYPFEPLLAKLLRCWPKGWDSSRREDQEPSNPSRGNWSHSLNWRAQHPAKKSPITTNSVPTFPQHFQ